MPSRPTIRAPVGKSGPVDPLEQSLEQLLVGRRRGGLQVPLRPPAPTSRRLCGGMLVAMPLVGQFGDDQDGAPLHVLLDRHDRAHPDRTATGAVGVRDPVPADDQPLVGKSGPGISLTSSSSSSSAVASG